VEHQPAGDDACTCLDYGRGISALGEVGRAGYNQRHERSRDSRAHERAENQCKP
jgi:hypothetical protein